MKIGRWRIRRPRRSNASRGVLSHACFDALFFRAFFLPKCNTGRVWESSHEYSIDGELRAVRRNKKQRRRDDPSFLNAHSSFFATTSTFKMISPATAAAFSYLGNSVTCIAIPREPLGKIYLNGTQLKENDEAQAGWKFFGITGLVASGSLMLADKAITDKDDRKKLNALIAGTSAAGCGMFAANGFCKDMVKPEMRIANGIMNAAVAGLAIKALIDDK